jgi:alkanesulfonate monooxygenase SsuD/methylene tetrahydromethanopterin reductase-like flavin-dependent oxidoreductase (luciferase family)
MRTACFLEPGRSLDDATERVKLAESLGYESVWLSHIAAREPLQVINHYAHHTERIGFGTGVIPIFLRHPALMAQEAATLDEITSGRLSLGIGTSHKITVEGWYGLTLDDPVGRMREYTQVLRQIFTGGGASVEGKHHTARFGFLGYRARPDLKIYWAAMGPKMLSAAAELADGVVLWMCSPSHIRTTIRPALEKALADHGRSFDEFDIVAAVPCGVTDDPTAGRDAFRQAATPYWQLPFYRKEIGAAHPDALAAFDERIASGDVPAALAAIPDEVVDDFAGVGDAEAVRRKVADYREAGVTLPAIGGLPSHQGSAGTEATLEAAAPGT